MELKTLHDCRRAARAQVQHNLRQARMAITKDECPRVAAIFLAQAAASRRVFAEARLTYERRNEASRHGIAGRFDLAERLHREADRQWGETLRAAGWCI